MMEKWKNGMMEKWNDGKMEKWKVGKLECWERMIIRNYGVPFEWSNPARAGSKGNIN